MQNKQGLSRYIPSDIRRAVRQRSGFGCVLCGCAIGEYEHVVPEFKDATSHNLDGIAYLCPTCHAKVTKGLIDKKTVLEAMRNPWAIRHGHCHDAFVIGDDNASVRLGGMTFYNCIALSIDNVPIFGILPPVQKGQPYRLFGTFTDQTGQVTLKIEDNEWLGNAKIWDIEVIGRRVIVRERQGKIALLIEAEPPQGINVKRLDMYLNDIRLVGSQESLWIKSRRYNTIAFEFRGGFTFEGRGESSKAIQIFSSGDLFIGDLKAQGFYGGGKMMFTGKKVKFLI